MGLDFSAALQEGKEEMPGLRGLTPTEVLEKYPILDIERAKQSFVPVIAGIDEIVSEMEALKVDSQEANQRATFLGATSAKLLKKIDEIRKAKTEEPKNFVDSVNAFARIFTDKLKTVKDLASKKTAQWQLFVEQERQKKEIEARKVAQELQEKLRKEAEEANRKAEEEAHKKAEENKTQYIEPQKIESPVVVEPIIPKKETTTRTEAGSASLAQRWTFKIIDASLVPREYLVVSETLLRDAVKAGIRTIPGVEIYQEAKSRFRT